MDNPKVSKYDLNKYSAVIANEFSFADKLNSTARQASAERAWSAISRFSENCKKKVVGLKAKSDGGKLPPPVLRGYPTFQKNNRSVEYKFSGWKLAPDRKSITMTDKNGIGKLRLMGTRDLNFYQTNLIKRVRLVKRADGYYCQFAISIERNIDLLPTHQTIGLDVGLESFYTDSLGNKVENPRFYRTGERKLKRNQRLVYRKVKGSHNRNRAKTVLGKVHLKISRQRIDYAVELERCDQHI